MKKATNMKTLIDNAKSHNYTPTLVGKQLLTFLCPECRKKMLVILVNEDGRRIKACPCGYRYNVKANERGVEDLNYDPTRCTAITKGGIQCKNKKKKGHEFCGPHCKARDPKVYRK